MKKKKLLFYHLPTYLFISSMHTWIQPSVHPLIQLEGEVLVFSRLTLYTGLKPSSQLLGGRHYGSHQHAWSLPILTLT